VSVGAREFDFGPRKNIPVNRGRTMRAMFKSESVGSFLASLAVLTILASLQTPAAAQDVATPATEQAPDAASGQPNAAPDLGQRPARRYFIDFRSRSAVSYGHTFVVHGRVGAKLTVKNVAGLHPMSDSSVIYMLGHILPVPSETGASDGDLESEYLTARYRIYLTEARYRVVAAYIKELQSDSPVWNAAVYNCNAFAADVARFMGLETPHIWELPKNFINALREMNTPRRSASIERPHRAHESMR
jgi:hypothetical protein